MQSRMTGLCLLCLLACNASAQTLSEAFTELQRDYRSSLQVWGERYGDPTTSEESIVRHREWPGWSFVPRFLAFAEEAGSTQEGFDAIDEVLKMGVSTFDQGLYDHYEAALVLLLENHRERDLRQVCTMLRYTQQSEVFLRALMSEGETKELRAEAHLRLGNLLRRKYEMCVPDSWARRPVSGEFPRYIRSRLQKNLQRCLADQDAEVIRLAAIECFEEFLRLYPKVLAFRRDQLLAVQARREIYALNYLAIGLEAPDIEDIDVDGKSMRLSEYRGRVVLLVFWASTCGPCLGDIPHEKELLSRFADRPFTIVGVNADVELEAARDAVIKHGVPWRSFWNGDGGLEGPIFDKWNVRSLPTIYVLDEKGVIRHKDLRREELDAPLEWLISKAETNK